VSVRQLEVCRSLLLNSFSSALFPLFVPCRRKNSKLYGLEI
jgi:hypothetical protein